MNKILYFIAGALLGAGGTWLFLHKRYEEKLNDELNRIIREDIEKTKKQSKKENEHSESSDGVILKYDENKDYSVYDTSTKDVPDDVVISPVDVEAEMLQSSEIIDENEYEDDYYDDEGNLYPKEELFYFHNNDVFTDGDCRPLNEMEDYVFGGDDIKQEIIYFLKNEDYDGECYIRCHNTKTDYMVICDFRDFREVGVFE